MLIATCRLKVNGKYVLPNEKFEVDKKIADDLIKRGRAKDEKSVPEGRNAVDSKAGPTVTKTESKAAATVNKGGG